MAEIVTEILKYSDDPELFDLIGDPKEDALKGLKLEKGPTEIGRFVVSNTGKFAIACKFHNKESISMLVDDLRFESITGRVYRFDQSLDKLLTSGRIDRQDLGVLQTAMAFLVSDFIGGIFLPRGSKNSIPFSYISKYCHISKLSEMSKVIEYYTTEAFKNLGVTEPGLSR